MSDADMAITYNDGHHFVLVEVLCLGQVSVLHSLVPFLTIPPGSDSHILCYQIYATGGRQGMEQGHHYLCSV